MNGNIISVSVRDDLIITKYLAVKNGKVILTRDQSKAVLVTEEKARRIIANSTRPLTFVGRRG